ncbi:MAG TPA: hypothetical protein PKN99_03810 [Cyclobacteriaceae bacterium]|nr:hypothetical protein [Cyclobacteriaceae bacterium]
MDNNEIKSLCLSLLKADGEAEVISILRKAGFWDNPKLWRLYGDTEDNYSAAGNQANEAEAALVEKITNSRDARLMLKCQLNGIVPQSAEAPQNMKEAIGKFFNVAPESEVQGEIKELTNSEITELAKGMTLSLTGKSPGKDREDVYPCVTIVDDGEGQTPDLIGETILSLNKSIKNRIKFTHGKFNMGGTAALTFCGEKNIQLVISRRHPKLIEMSSNPSGRDHEWGFTIVRREFPEGNRTKSWYKYLAPIAIDNNPDEPKILSFKADTLPLFPESNEAYSRETEWGTLIKLYEYQTKKRSHALRDSGLLRPLEVLLPEIGLPLRIHECRKSYKGHEGSFANNLTGLQHSLSLAQDNLEINKPISDIINIDGHKFEMLIYVFKSKKAGRTYRDADKGIIFSLNGQAQGWFHERFFMRKAVKMDYLKESLSVIVDCSNLDYGAQEQLFQNSRDRLSTKPIRAKLEAEIEDSLKNNPILRELREKRRRERTHEKLIDSKPLEETLRKVIKHNKTLSTLFLLGNRSIETFKPREVSLTEKEYLGKRFPSFFKFKKIEYGRSIDKSCYLNRRARINFETDVENDYFKRENSKGDFKLFHVVDGKELNYGNYKINLSNGIATLNVSLPENIKVGDKLNFSSKLFDINHQFDPFTNNFSIIVLDAIEDEKERPSRPRTEFPNDGDGRKGSKSGGITLPENIYEVSKDPLENQINWNDERVEGEFDEHTAIIVKSNGLSDDDFNANGYDWFINVSNRYLLSEMKMNPDDADIIKAQYTYGLVILGISQLFTESIQSKEIVNDNTSQNSLDFPDMIKELGKSISPVLVPIINELSKIRDKEMSEEN